MDNTISKFVWIVYRKVSATGRELIVPDQPFVHIDEIRIEFPTVESL